jgi:hypothetical protein
MALKDCAKKFGAALNKSDLDAIQRLIDGGTPEADAVKYHLDKLDKAAAPEVELVAYHNLSAEKLIASAKMGGLAVPSIAITKKGSPHSGFGEITLIGKKELVDPAVTPVYDADAYTVRYPTPFYGPAKSKAVQALVDGVRAEAKEFNDGSAIYEPWDKLYGNIRGGRSADPHGAIQSMLRSDAWKAKYLREQGVDVKPIMRVQKHLDFLGDYPALKKFFKENQTPDGWYNNRDSDDVVAWTKKAKAAIVEAIDQYAESKSKGDPELKAAYMESSHIDNYVDDKTGELYFAPMEKLERGMQDAGTKVVDSRRTSDALNKNLVGKESDYLRWLEHKVIPLMPSPQLEMGRKKVDYTLDNIVEFMARKGKGTEGGAVFGEGNTRALVAKRFKNFDQLRKAAVEGIQSESEVSAAREEAKQLMEAYRDKVYVHHNARNWRGNVDTFEALDSSMRAIARLLKMPMSQRNAKGMEVALRAEDFDITKINDQILEMGVDAANALMIAPVPYFEAKPGRAVKLTEFAGAAIPASAPQEVRDVLDQHGIPYTTYARDNKGLREKAINKFTEKLSKKQTVLFQSQVDGVITEKQFYKDFVQHVDVRGRTEGDAELNRDSILKNGFTQSTNVNAFPVSSFVNPSPFMGKFKPKVGDVVYFAPKGQWKDGPNGIKINNGWKPTQSQAVRVTADNVGMSPYDMYLNGNKLFQSSKSPIGFYSELAAAANNLKQEKGTPEQMLAQLTKTPGIKQAEIEATGIDDYLKLVGKSVTKQQIVDYLDANGVQVEETVLGGMTVSSDDDGSLIEESGDAVKYSSYQLPGGEEYRELLLTLPDRNKLDLEPKVNDRYTTMSPDDIRAEYKTTQTPESYRRAIDSVMSTGAMAEVLRKLNGMPTNADVFKRNQKKIESSSKNNFYSGHYPQSNILAHIRFNERADADGNRVLFIEEIQSDWAQAGRKKGFGNDHLYIVVDDEGFTVAEYDTENEAREMIKQDDSDGSKNYKIAKEKNRDVVPLAPFVTNTDAWTSLALKRMITYAVENNFDRVAWTTGKQQAERYKLSQQVESIRIHQTERGFDEGMRKILVTTITGSTIEMYVNNDGVLSDTMGDARLAGKSLDDVIGKDMARKIMDMKPHEGEKQFLETIEGENLDIGGEGMKSFYDSIIPKNAKNIIKKMGGELSTVNLGDEDSDGFSVQQGFDITDKMREQVASRGMSLFQKATRNDIGLYSAVEQAAIDVKLPQWVKGAPAPGNEIWSKISKTPGVKAEELKWMGLEEFLKTPPAKFTREQVLEFIKANGVDVVQVTADNRNEDGDEADADYGDFVWSESVDDDDMYYESEVERLVSEYGTDSQDPELYRQALNSVIARDQDKLTEMFDGNVMVDGIIDETADEIPQGLYIPSKKATIAELSDEDKVKAVEIWKGASMDQRRAWIKKGRDENPNGKFKPEVVAYVKENMADQLQKDYAAAAEIQARDQYMEDPFTIYEDSDTNIRIEGNVNNGYRIIDRDGDVYREGISSFSEAEIQARELVSSPESNDPRNQAKWGEYVMDGDHRHYRELKLTLPNLGGDKQFIKSTHFYEPNIVSFLRVTDRDLMTGEIIPQVPPRKVDYTVQVKGDGDIKVLSIREAGSELLIASARLKSDADINKSVSETIAAMADPARRKGVERILSFNKGYVVNDEGGITYDTGTIKPKTKNTYFIDEFQSDWHQEGRKKGYRTGDPSTLLGDEINGLTHAIETVIQRLFEKSSKYSDRFVTMETNNARDKIAVFNYESGDGTIRQDTVSKYNFMQHAWDILRQSNTGEIDVVSGMLTTERLFTAEIIKNATENGDIDITEWNSKVKRYDEVDKLIRAEREGVPDAPFKDDAWLTMGLKRAIVDAVEQGNQAIAWPNAAVLSERWSSKYGELYTMQYDKKMPSIVKKLTGLQPKLMNADGEEMMSPEQAKRIKDEYEALSQKKENYMRDVLWSKYSEVAAMSFNDFQYNVTRLIKFDDYMDVRPDADGLGKLIPPDELKPLDDIKTRLIEIERMGVDATEQGYWIIPITPELKAQVKENSYPLFQPTSDLDNKRGAIQLLANDKRIIQLGKQSDPSTFLHESAHLFLELEKQLANEFGITKNQQRLLDWLGVEAFDDIERAHHEKYAETFEVYLETGKAPSAALRDAFAQFRRWLTEVYRIMKGRPNADLTPEITEYFDRLLATEEEIELARANPVFDQFFRSKEQSGMTDAEWDKYQEQGKRVANTALATVDAKIVAELKKRKSEEWRDEKEPMVDEEKARLSKLPVYAVLRDAATSPMDYDAVKEAAGGKLPGKLIGRAKKGGVNPMDYAEAYGYPSVKAMLDAIEQSPALGKAADDAAQQRMIARYGDILNDGSIENEARQAIHNEEQAKLLLMELKALNKKTLIDRDYLESEARRMIAGMKYSEIKPDKYFKAEIRAAKKAVAAKTDADKFEAKAQQIANHYLYRRAMEVKDQMESQRKYVRGIQTRSYNPKDVHPSHIANLKLLAKSYEMRKDDPQRPRNYESILDWMITQMNDENHYVQLEVVDVNLAKAMVDREAGKPVSYTFPGFDDMTAEELTGLYDQLKHLRFVGGKMSENAGTEMMISRINSAASITNNAQKIIPPQHERSALASVADSVVKFGFSHLRIRSIFNTLDGYESKGAMDKEYQLITNAFNKELALTDQLAKSMDAAFKPVFKIINRRKQTTITKQDGRDWTLTNRARFVLGLNWGNEGNRQALLEGLNNKFQDNYTEADVMKMLGSMSREELQALNDVWDAKEALWPELSGAQVRIKGVAPPKIQATPFEVNGVKLKGGHYRLHYVVDPADSGRRDLTIEDSKRDSILMKTASSLNERVGSGGRQVDLDLDHLFRDVGEDIHYIAFAEQAEHLNAMFKGAKNPVVAAITKGYGQPYYDNLIATLDGFIHPAEPTTGMWKAMRYVRTNLTYAYLAGSIRNVVQQPVAITNAFSQLGAANTLAGALDFYTDPVKNWERIREKSAFMRNRTELVNREAAEQLSKIDSIHPVWGAIKRGAFMPQTFVDSLVAFPTWMGALRKFQLENPTATEDEGIRYADEMVKHTIGSGLAMDLGNILSGTEAEKQITFMGSFFNLTTNMHVENYQLYKRDKISGFEYARRLGWMAVAPAILTAWLLDDLPEDEEDSTLLAMLKKVLFYNFSSVFMVRDLVSAFDGFEPSIPGLSFGKGVTRVTKEMAGLITGDEEFDMNTIASIIRGVQPLVPVPGSGQVARTIEGMSDEDQGAWGAIVEGKERN